MSFITFHDNLRVYRLKDAAVLIKAGHAKIACSVAICDAVKEKGSLIWPITERIGKYLSGNDATHCLLALFTADVLVINGGYRAHMAVTRKVFLNLMAYRFPPSPKYSLDTAHQAALRLIGKWEVALGKLSPMAADFENIIKIASLLRDRGFSLPYPTEEEIKIILNGRKGSLAISSEEELENETKVFLETKLEFLIQRGSPADLKGAKEIISILADFDNVFF